MVSGYLLYTETSIFVYNAIWISLSFLKWVDIWDCGGGGGRSTDNTEPEKRSPVRPGITELVESRSGKKGKTKGQTAARTGVLFLLVFSVEWGDFC